jgi:hypothetical protein
LSRCMLRNMRGRMLRLFPNKFMSIQILRALRVLSGE